MKSNELELTEEYNHANFKKNYLKLIITDVTN